MELVFGKLKPLLEDPKIKKVGQNIKYDYIVLKNEGVHLKGIVFDTMLASYLLNPSRRGHNMDALALEHFGHTTIKYKDLVGTASNEVGFDEVEVERSIFDQTDFEYVELNKQRKAEAKRQEKLSIEKAKKLIIQQKQDRVKIQKGKFEESGLMNKISRLKELYINGTLNKAEFEKAKNKLLK